MSKITLVSWPDLKTRGIMFSRATIYRKIDDGTFPRPLKLGANKIAWLESEIDDWIASIAAARVPARTP
jgi:prophage regulatory protein